MCFGRSNLSLTFGIVGLSLTLAFPVQSAPVPSELRYVALGTNAGPTPNPKRSQPAGVVRAGDAVILVDAGDGVTGQLARRGIAISQVQAVAISHLHFDHTGGLFGFLALRRQTQVSAPLTIYGPPGIKATVEGLLQAMHPGNELLTHLRSDNRPLGEQITVVEMTEGHTAVIGAVKLTATENSHFIDVPANSRGERPVSLSYRFNASGGSLVYTGDTGPSEAVAQLCRGASMLVSEVMDPHAMTQMIKKERPDLPDQVIKAAEDHFVREHLSPQEVGLLASRCGARALVLVHSSLNADEIPQARAAMRRNFKGRIFFAEDLQEFIVPAP